MAHTNFEIIQKDSNNKILYACVAMDAETLVESVKRYYKKDENSELILAIRNWLANRPEERVGKYTNFRMSVIIKDNHMFN